MSPLFDRLNAKFYFVSVAASLLFIAFVIFLNGKYGIFTSIQDVILAIGDLWLWLALMPSVFNPSAKPDTNTSLMTATILLIVAIAITTLGLYFAAFMTALSVITWYILLYQRMKQNLRNKKEVSH